MHLPPVLLSVPGFCQILLSFHQEFQFHYISTHDHTERQAQVSVLDSQCTTQAMQTLKDAFISATLLIHGNPDKPFVVEVSTPTNGVGELLHRSHQDSIRLPSFPRTLLQKSETDWKSWASCIKLALEEWKHWLKGARQSFLSDHRPSQPRVSPWGQEVEPQTKELGRTILGFYFKILILQDFFFSFILIGIFLYYDIRTFFNVIALKYEN